MADRDCEEAQPRRQAETDLAPLVRAALVGDEEALGRLLADQQTWAYNVAYRVVGHEADARDAVQEAFLLTVRAFRGDGSPPQSVEAFRPWLRRVVVNAALTQVRRRPVIQPVPVEAVAEQLMVAESGAGGASVEHEELRGQVVQALLGLPENQRVALVLREYLGASYDEIAEALELPRTAIGTLLFRARAGFRATFDRVAETAPPPECPDLIPLFSAIVDEEPRPASWQVLEAHLRDCERCSRALTEQRRARRLYALVPLLTLPAGWEPVQAAILAAGSATASAGGAGAPTASASAGAGATGASAASAGGAGGSTGAAVGGGGAVAGGVLVGAATGGAVATGSAGAGGLLAGLFGPKLVVGALAVVATVGAVAGSGVLDQAPSPPGVVASPSPAAGGSPATGLTLPPPQPAGATVVASPLPAVTPGSAGSGSAEAATAAIGLPSPAPTPSESPSVTVSVTPNVTPRMSTVSTPLPAAGTPAASPAAATAIETPAQATGTAIPAASPEP